MKHCLLIVFCLLSMVSLGQPDRAPEVMPHDSTAEHDEGNEWKMLFGFDARNSFALGHKANFFGMRIGAKVNNLHRFGMGIYWLKAPIHIEDRPPEDFSDAYDTSLVRVDFGYSTFFYERVLKSHPRYEITLPLHLGTGTIRTSYLDTGLIYQDWFERRVPLTELSVAGSYKFIRFMSIQGDVGYRVMLTGNRQSRKAFSSPIYRIGLSLELGEVWRAIWRKKYPEENVYWDEQRRKRKDRRAQRRAE